MRYTKIYTTFILRRGSPDPTSERTIRHAVFPGAFGGTRTRENTVYLTAREALIASGMLLRMCPGEVSRARVAQGIGRLLDRLPRTGKTTWLRRAVRQYAGDRPVSDVATLWNCDGRVETGTRVQLAQATGLEYNRVRDLLAGRRSSALGWAASPERAQQGPGKRGPKPRVRAPDIFKDEFDANFF
jgi:uncharacterized protein YidB (DUF937 family)